MATIKTLAGRIWNDPIINIPPGTPEENVNILMGDLRNFDRPEAELIPERDGHRIKVTFKPKNNSREFGKTTRAFYVKPKLERFLENVFKKLQTK